MIEHTPNKIDEGESVLIAILDMKLGEVIDELNRFESYTEAYMDGINSLFEKPKEPAKKEETTAYYSMVYTASELDRAKSEAVEAYKKRLVDRFMDLYDPYDKENTNMIVLLYQAMREADHKPSKYLTAEGMREYDGSKWV